MYKSINVLGTPLVGCSHDPLTGWYRDGCCNTDASDRGSHTVCAQVTQDFLEYLQEQGNDLLTPYPGHGFPGLKDGDQWCICATSWAQAFRAGKACPVLLESTHSSALQFVKLEELMAASLAPEA
jgi:uncharacterized protein (DUF2237 family)